MIYILSSKKTTVQALDKKVLAETLPPYPAKHTVRSEDQTYLDISGLSAGELKKALNSLKKCCAGFFWGIIDPKGEAADPAQFFFEGASDYIGPLLVKQGLTQKRFNAARPWKESGAAMEAADTNSSDTTGGKNRKNQKMPGGKFEGWKSIQPGIESPFFFLYVSLSGKSNLRAILGEAVFNTVKTRLRDILQQNLREADPLLWMETESNSLFLVPPRAANGRAAIEASLKLILNSHLISIEKLGLSISVEFTAALHYGKSVFRPPGKTGTVISDAVNYIFHLGTKRAEPGRLTASGDVPPEAFPEGLLDLFTPAGIFEGIPIKQSKKFV